MQEDEPTVQYPRRPTVLHIEMSFLTYRSRTAEKGGGFVPLMRSRRVYENWPMWITLSLLLPLKKLGITATGLTRLIVV